MADNQTVPLQTQLKKGLLLLKQRKVAEAASLFQVCVEKYPKDASAQLLYGIALSRVSPTTKAADEIEKAVAMAPQNASIATKAINALNRCHRPYRALKLLKKLTSEEHAPVALYDLYYNIARKAGWYWEGFDAIKEAIRKEPHGTQRQIGLARLLFNMRDYDAAASILAPVVDGENKVSVEAYYLHADILKELERREEAVKTVELALHQQERTTKTLLTTSEYQIQLGGLKNAKANIEEALELDPTSVDGLNKLAQFCLWEGDVSGARNFGTKIEALETDHPDGRRIEAACLVMEEQYSEAMTLLDRLIEEDEQDSIALLLRGDVKRSLLQYDDAVKDIDMGIIHANGYTIQANVSRLYTISEQQNQRTGRFDPDAYEELIQLAKPILPDPEKDVLCDGNSLQVRALVKHIFESFEGNRTPETTYIRRDDETRTLQRLHIQAHSRFASRYAQELIRSRSVEEVLAYFDEMIAEDPSNPIVYTHSGEVLLWLGRYEESLTEFKKSIAITKNVRWAYIGLCANELMLERYDKALQWCEDGIKAFPPPGRTMFPYRAEVYRKMGRLDLALKDIQKAQQITPGRMTGWMNEALIHHDRGDSSLLVPAYKKVMERSPCLVETALDEMGQPFLMEAPTQEGIIQLFEYSMEMMRGNRSSDFVTYFTKEGEFRFVPPPDIPDPVYN